MSTFNKAGVRIAPRSINASSPLATVSTTPDTVTFEGAPGYARTPRTELYLACTSSFITESAFYEKGDARVDRVRGLARTIAIGEDGEQDGADWLYAFLTWLRGAGNIRTAGIVVAVEAVRARILAGRHGGNRALIGAACGRADEPGELLACWLSRFGKPLPHAVKRGLADAMRRLYTPYATFKYDSARNPVRFGDVLGLASVRPSEPMRSRTYRHLIERRHPHWTFPEDGRAADGLDMVMARRALEEVPVAERRVLLGTAELTGRMKLAGCTWEWLSGWLADGKGMDAAAWKAALPQMGYMARLRNLANLDRAGVDDATADVVGMMLADPQEVAKSRQLPFRFLAAYREALDDRWKPVLGRALKHSVRNIPELSGRTLIMVDTSDSMTDPMSEKSDMRRVDAAALFGVALANRNLAGADVYGFADREFHFDVAVGASVLREVERFTGRVGAVGHGTQLAESTMAAWSRRKNGYDRVIIFSDMQAFGAIKWSPYGHLLADSAARLSEAIPRQVPIYAFDLAGYPAGITPAGGENRFQLGGLTDATFRLIPQFEAGVSGRWPWESDG